MPPVYLFVSGSARSQRGACGQAHGRLEDEYELLERHQALERKLAVIERTATAALQLLQHHSNLRVEGYIVILIVAEILLLLFDMLVLR